MTVEDLAARERRLDELARGLAAEVTLVKAGGEDDVLLARERKAYLEAVHDALAGVEEARVTLERVRGRLSGRRGG